MSQFPHEEQQAFRSVILPHMLSELPAGQLDLVPGTTKDYIPKRLVQFWDETPPPDVQTLLDRNATWASRNDVSYHLYCEKDVEEYLTGRTQDGYELLDVFRSCFHPAMKADFFRLVTLYDHGGLYLDADNVLSDKAAVVFSYDRDVFFFDKRQLRVQNNYFAVLKNSPFVLRLLGKAIQNIMTRENDTIGIGILTGPYLFTRQLYETFEASQAYECYLVDYLAEADFARDGKKILGKKLAYKNTKMNWQVAQSEPLFAANMEKFLENPKALRFYFEAARISKAHNIQYEKFIAVSAQTFEHFKHNGRAVEVYSRALLKLQQNEKAMDVLRTGLQASGRSAFILRSLAPLLAKHGNLDEAEKVAAEAYSKQPKMVETTLVYCRILSSAGKLAECRKIYEDASAEHPGNERLQMFYNNHLKRDKKNDD